MAAELFYADRQADITKLKVTLHNFANAPKKTRIPKYGMEDRNKGYTDAWPKNLVVFSKDASSYFTVKQNSKCLATFCVLRW